MDVIDWTEWGTGAEVPRAANDNEPGTGRPFRMTLLAEPRRGYRPRP